MCHQRQPLLDGLRRQEPVEGITVMSWQEGETQRVGNGDWELVEVCGAAPPATMPTSALILPSTDLMAISQVATGLT